MLLVLFALLIILFWTSPVAAGLGQDMLFDLPCLVESKATWHKNQWLVNDANEENIHSRLTKIMSS